MYVPRYFMIKKNIINLAALQKKVLHQEKKYKRNWDSKKKISLKFLKNKNDNIHKNEDQENQEAEQTLRCIGWLCIKDYRK